MNPNECRDYRPDPEYTAFQAKFRDYPEFNPCLAARESHVCGACAKCPARPEAVSTPSVRMNFRHTSVL